MCSILDQHHLQLNQIQPPIPIEIHSNTKYINTSGCDVPRFLSVFAMLFLVLFIIVCIIVFFICVYISYGLIIVNIISSCIVSVIVYSFSMFIVVLLFSRVASMLSHVELTYLFYSKHMTLLLLRVTPCLMSHALQLTIGAFWLYLHSNLALTSIWSPPTHF